MSKNLQVQHSSTRNRSIKMGFRSKSMKKKTKSGAYDVKITKEDQKNMKVRQEESQVLKSVNEAQPFQEALDLHNMNRQSMGNFLAQRKNKVDSFGMPIRNPDVSNPSRSRDERPLDTIRSFEFAITGDQYYKERLETPKLGFRTRPEFPLFTQSPHNNQSNGNYEQPVYTKPVSSNAPAKKKRGLFGRKK